MADEITQEEFELAYAKRSGIGLNVFRSRMIGLPCRCGEDSCEGWAAVNRNRDAIQDHLDRAGKVIPAEARIHARGMRMAAKIAERRFVQWRDEAFPAGCESYDEPEAIAAMLEAAEIADLIRAEAEKVVGLAATRREDDGLPSRDEIEIKAAAKAISRDYGSVIGSSQARDIAYTTLVAARQAKDEAVEAEKEPGNA